MWNNPEARLDVLPLPTLVRRLGDRVLLASQAPDLPDKTIMAGVPFLEVSSNLHTGKEKHTLLKPVINIGRNPAGNDIVINEPFHEPMNDADAELLLLSMVNRLSKRESEVFSYHLARFTDQEIAQLLEISPSSVQSYRESARRRLQAMMDDGANGGTNEDR